ncbi:MAG TPA: isoamylase early set domain-containing protein [Gemmatimonadales bacterium]|nr:isoamylase early set domain-containing protein [Gemmatimonadales bacterium]
MSQEFDPRVKQVLDGEAPVRDLPPALRAEAEAALRALAALDRRDVSLSPDLDARVMAAVRRRAASPSHRAWRWFTAPSVPPWGLAAAAAAAILAFVLFRPASVAIPEEASLRETAAGPESVYVRFVLSAPHAQRVALAGTFNRWDPSATPLVRVGEEGTWIATVRLAAGQHQYAFVVDGQSWVPDPAAPKVDDGFGRKNSVVSVSATQGRVL